MISIKQVAKNAGRVISENSPNILTGLGCAGLISTAILTGAAVPKALHTLEKHPEAETLWQKAKVTWKHYIPATAVGAASIGCIIGANAVNARRNAAIAALYTMTDTAFKEYKTKVVEEIGKAREGKIRDEVAKSRVMASPPEKESIISTGKGNILCYDALSDRYFESSYESIRSAINTINYELIDQMWIPLNDLYIELGLPENKLGRGVGFSIDNGKLEHPSSTVLDDKGRPCLVLDLDVSPRYR